MLAALNLSVISSSSLREVPPRNSHGNPGDERGADVRHELEVPFQSAVTGGQAQLTVQRPSGKVETITVKIPAGIGDGKVIRLRGQGEEGVGGGSSGDLLITVRVSPHPFFERRGDDLQVVVPVTLAEAALGAKVDVPTPKGLITLKVPPGTSSGKRLRVKGHGVPRRNGEAGDLLAIVQITLPETIDEESQDFFRRLRNVIRTIRGRDCDGNASCLPVRSSDGLDRRRKRPSRNPTPGPRHASQSVGRAGGPGDSRIWNGPVGLARRG